MDDLKRSRKEIKALKEQLEIAKELIKQIVDLHRELKKQLKIKEEELHYAKGKSKELEEN